MKIMKIEEQKVHKWYKVKAEGIVVDTIINQLGVCKIVFENLSPQNKIYLGEIGYRKVREIAKILNKIADMGEEAKKVI